ASLLRLPLQRDQLALVQRRRARLVGHPPGRERGAPPDEPLELGRLCRGSRHPRPEARRDSEGGGQRGHGAAILSRPASARAPERVRPRDAPVLGDGRAARRIRVRLRRTRPAMIRTAVLLCALVCVLPTRSALAQVDPFEFEVYPAQTVGKGMVEIESLNSFVPRGHTHGDAGTSAGDFPSDRMYRTALEFTYGLTDKVEAAAYLNLAHPDGSSLQYAGSKFRVRGSLFEQGELPVDLGWYAELEWNKTPQFDDEDLELELKPIISKDWRRIQIALNPKFVKALVGPGKSDGFEF